MMELIRNCPHGSEIATYLDLDKDNHKIIVKSSSTVSGINNLRREINGWDWYQSVRYANYGFKFAQIIQNKKDYLKIHIRFISGLKPDYRKGLAHNAGIVDKVIDHYGEMWPHEPLSALHGDLSLDNVIYNSEGVHVIDWEHFALRAAPWGLDGLYFLFESLWFSLHARNKPSAKEITIIAQNIKKLNSSFPVEGEILKNPLLFTRDFLIKNRTLWGDQIIKFPDKFPILKFNDNQISLIDRMVQSLLTG